MKFICHSDLCAIYLECDCESNCCKGHKRIPLIIEYLNDNEIKTNNSLIEYQVMHEDIVEMVMRHECPFCGMWVEA